jgi:eukaryotic-like serine/threonine-protein kinase
MAILNYGMPSVEAIANLFDWPQKPSLRCHMLGCTLGHYRVVEAIGAGGMGVVYRAHDERLNRDVVLKVLPLQTDSDRMARAHLVCEAQTAAALNHPYICVIHEVGEENGHVFIAMEYIQGQTLDALVSHSKMRPAEIIRYGCQIAEALEHAHSKGVVHRDLKTANVMITPEARVKVLDFGLAKRLRTDELERTLSQSLVAQGQIAGTLPYMAPEVLHGAPADERVDIWALGVMLYEMCAGIRPFQGGSPYELTSAILRDDPPPLPATVPAGLNAVIDRCLTKEPSRRYQRAGEVHAALEGIQAGSVAALPPVLPVRSGLRPLAGAALAVLAIGLAMFVYWFFAVHAPIRSVAVLPFSGSSTDTEYLNDGITDSLIDSISRLPQVKVISHTSAFHYRGKEVDPRTVGHELGVGAVIIGRVLSHGDTVSVSVELVDASDNTRLWGEQYTRKISDVPAMQREISQEIGEQLRVRVSGDQKRRLLAHSTEDSEAYQLYLRGRYYWYKGTPESYETARRYFEQAIEKDPAYALAYTGLGGYYMLLENDGYMSAREAFPKIKALALKALEIDPNLGPGHNTLGAVALYYDWNLPEAERQFKRALELENWETPYRNYAICLRAMGRLDEAIAAGKHASELDPFSVSVHTSLGSTLYFTHHYPEAIEQFQTSIAMDPGFLKARYGLANSYQQNHMEKEALEAWQAYIRASGGSDSGAEDPASELGKIYVNSGYWTAMRTLRQAALDANTEAARHGYISPMVFAGLHAALGNKDEAFEWLEKAYAERSSKLLDLKLDPDFDSLRRDPRYADLVRRIGLP